MPWHNLALVVAGLIGAAVSVMHGVLVQRLIVEPFARHEAAIPAFSPVVRRLIAPLIHFSTVVWFIGGIALMFAASTSGQARLWIGLLVGGAYLFGAVGNFWATRGWHPGWMLMTIAIVLIVFGVSAPLRES